MRMVDGHVDFSPRAMGQRTKLSDQFFSCPFYQRKPFELPGKFVHMYK